jgi:hypothetical protein
MSLSVTECVAIYGGVLSTVLAAVQIRAAILARRFFYVSEELGIARSRHGMQSFIIFHVSNGGSAAVTIRHAWISDYRKRYERLFEWLLGRDVLIYSLEKDRRNPSLPVVLKPGDSIEFYADIVNGMVQNPDDVDRVTRYLVLSHSQSRQCFEHRFKPGISLTSSSWVRITDVSESRTPDNKLSASNRPRRRQRRAKPRTGPA